MKSLAASIIFELALIGFLFLSIMFFGLALFTRRRSAETLNFELFHAYKTLNASAPADSGEGAK